MTERPTTDRHPGQTLATIAAALVVVAAVLSQVFGLGWLEVGLVLVALLVVTSPALVPAFGFYLWAKRRGDLH
jgi:hypothetical protein